MVRHAFLRRALDQFQIVDFFDAANRNVFPRGHFIAHEVLEDDSNFAMKIFQIVVAKVDAIQQNLSFGRVVEPGDQFDDGRLALSVLADQREPLFGMQLEIDLVQNSTRVSRITERNIPEFNSAHDRPRRRQGVGLGLDGRFHFEECQQICEE